MLIVNGVRSLESCFGLQWRWTTGIFESVFLEQRLYRAFSRALGGMIWALLPSMTSLSLSVASVGFCVRL
ncbi:hypothetical protein BDW67DRAFT_151060 [Aspergillus spinulosporus]